MTQVKQKVYLITEQQRDALLNYLLNRPYREVASGVEFLNNAPSTMLNIEIPDPEVGSLPTEEKSQSQINLEEESKIEVVPAAKEELTVFSSR